jgi:hypothetical protein
MMLHDVNVWPGPRLHVAGHPDTDMREGWMKGKINPATGQPPAHTTRSTI